MTVSELTVTALALLSTLADQTAVALENARLVDDLIWLNQDLNKALAALALVKYVVAAHGSQVRAESQEGVGSTFGFQVPLSGPQAAGPAPGWSRTTR